MWGREVAAASPVRSGPPLARGCHRLIRDGAALVERPQDVIDLLAPAAARTARDLLPRLRAPTSDNPAGAGELDAENDPPAVGATGREPDPAPGGPTSTSAGSDHQTLWCALGHDPSGMDQLVERTGLTPARLSSMLLIMELEGRVAAQHGRYFRNR